MNNYINVRVQAHNHTKTYNSIKHNLRVIQSLSQKKLSTNDNYIMLDNKVIKITKENKKDLYKQLSSAYQNERLIHNEIYKKHNKRNLRECKSTWCEGVFTFSDQMVEDLKNKKYNLNDLTKVANECLKEIAATYNTQINYMVLHLDETKPHFQWSFSNYDDRGMSLYFSNKNKEFLSKLQDIGFKHFSALGMERGISKEFTNSNHIDANTYWRNKNIKEKQLNNELKKQNQILKHQNKDIENSINKEENHLNKLKSLSSSLNNEITSLKSDINDNKIKIEDLKIERETISKDNTKSKEEKKILYSEITQKQKELRDLNEDIKEVIKSKKDISNDLSNDINFIVEQSVTFNKFVNVEKLQQHIKKILLKYLKLNTQLNELKEKEERIKNLENVVEKSDTYIQRLEKEVNSLNSLDKEKSDLIKEYMAKEKEEKRFTNSEVATVTQKYENELKEKKQTIKQQKQKIETLESENVDYKDFIADNNLESDFNNRNHKKYNINRKI